jgi:uncharacterized protein YhdP
VAGRHFPQVQLGIREDADGLQVRADSASLAGVLYVPHEISSRSPATLELARLEVAPAENAASPAALVAALAPAARVDADSVIWNGRRLGTVHARFGVEDDRLHVQELLARGPSHELRAAGECERAFGRCRVAVQIDSHDVTQTLRDFAFAPEVAAQRATLIADVEWQPDGALPALASLGGKVTFTLEEGRVLSAPAQDASPPFALLTIPALLREEGGTVAGDGAGQVAFRRLEADYSLRDGQAFTANLHFDGEAEVLARGRVGLVDRDYDQVAWVLEGEERLPAALRRFAATPRVAAAWLRLRDWFGAPDVGEPSAVVRLHGSWARPIASAPVELEEND